jgi:hypothetical protein
LYRKQQWQDLRQVLVERNYFIFLKNICIYIEKLTSKIRSLEEEIVRHKNYIEHLERKVTLVNEENKVCVCACVAACFSLFIHPL